MEKESGGPRDNSSGHAETLSLLCGQMVDAVWLARRVMRADGKTADLAKPSRERGFYGPSVPLLS